MSNTQKNGKMNTSNTQNVENQTINNIKMTTNTNESHNFFVVVAKINNWNATIVGQYKNREIATRCANDYLQMIKTYGTGNMHKITEIVINGSSI